MTKGLLIEGPAFIVLSPFVLQTFQVFLMAHSEACRSPSFPLTAKVIDLSISLPHLFSAAERCPRPPFSPVSFCAFSVFTHHRPTQFSDIPFMIFNGYAVESNGEK